ncbi:hypothetical protein [Glycomyces artemisiae]|nr:hypothetical protein [Glycomyces artemisiae]
MNDAKGRPPEFYRLPSAWPKPRTRSSQPGSAGGEWIGANIQGDYLHANRDMHVRIDAVLAEDALKSSIEEDAGSGFSEEDLNDVLSPPDRDLHLQALTDTRLLVLSGARRTGLTTAVWLRARVLAQRLNVRVQALTSTNSEELHRDMDRKGGPVVFVLDMSRNTEFETEVSKLVPRIKQLLDRHERYLVIAVEERFGVELEGDCEGSIFTLRCLTPDRVFEHYYKAGEAAFVAVRASEEYFRKPLRTAWPPRARQIAEILNEAQRDLTPEQFGELIDHALGKRPRILQEMTGNRLDADGRAILVAAAALETSPAETLIGAADGLAAEVRGTGWAIDPMDDQGLTQRIRAIGEVFRLTDSRFIDVHLGDSVLPYVWEEYPQWRGPLASWLDRLLARPGEWRAARFGMLPNRVYQLAKNDRNPAFLLDRAHAMAESIMSEIRGLAVELLVAGVLNSDIGPGVKRRLYIWSRSASAPVQLAVVAACGDERYLASDTDSALTRIRHLADSPHSEVRMAARKVIVQQAPNHLSPVDFLGYLAICMQPSSFLCEAVPGIFYEAFADHDMLRRLQSGPEELVGDRSGHIAAFWAQILDQDSPPLIARVLKTWLAAAARIGPFNGEAMALMPANAVPGQYRRLGRLSRAASLLSAPAIGALPLESRLSALLMKRLFEIEVHLR